MLTAARVEQAQSYETGVTIISPAKCRQAVRAMRRMLKLELGNEEVAMVPVLEGGRVIGQEATGALGVEPVYMQMSNYSEDGIRLPKPRVISEPDYERMLGPEGAKRVEFVEAVVDSRATIDAARGIIQEQLWDRFKVEAPAYGVTTLVTKYQGEWDGWLVRALFQVAPELWVWGEGCDSNGRGRDLNRIDAMVSPMANGAPQWPYVKQLYRPNIPERLLYLAGL